MNISGQIEKEQKRHKAYYLAHREEILARGRRHYHAHREERRAYEIGHRGARQAYRHAHLERQATLGRAWQKSHPGAARKSQLKTRYGLAQIDFERFLADQGGACAVCKKTDWNGRAPHIDHDHATGQVRGILCRKCNLALGHINDDLTIAQAVVDYLKKFKTEEER